MESTQPPVQWLPGFLSSGREAEAWIWPLILSGVEINNDELYLSSPMCLHGMDRDSFILPYFSVD
jgi:hypothetical protein